jgi:hypothetical protein
MVNDFEHILDDLGELYHEYSFFGIRNKQLPGIFRPNQLAKAPVITSYIAQAIAACKDGTDTKVTFVELFCADAYYAMVARRLGATECLAIDNNRDGYFPNAQKIASRLGIDSINFLNADVDSIDTLPSVDIVANVGGLYHVSNPKEILTKSYALASRFLIVQSVVSLTTDSDSYFESPAPGWTWGSRLSKNSFDRMIRELRYKVIHSHFNELKGNERAEDRGSIYYLIEKD